MLASFLEKGEVFRHHVVGHFGTGSLDGVPAFYEHPMLKAQVRIVLKNCGIIDPEDIDHYLARGGYLALERCLAMPWSEVLEIVKRAGLRGRAVPGSRPGRSGRFAGRRRATSDISSATRTRVTPEAFMNRSLIEAILTPCSREC